jgi:hypothetical protein
MPELSREDREKVIPLLKRIREELKLASAGNLKTLHQMRRYVAKRLEFDERGTPMQRRKLKDEKWKKQRGLCANCGGELPERGSELDRFDPVLGYTDENTRLICHKCHREAQEARNFS